MADVKMVIDGIQVTAETGMTVLEVAESAGIPIPTLCYMRGLLPIGGCRICLVEMEGANRLIGACHTPVVSGMVIKTQSPRVRKARKTIIELMLAGHTGPCVSDERIGQCELNRIAAEVEAGPAGFRVRKERTYPVEDASPYITRDLTRCIRCGRCIKACSEIVGQDVYSTGYRGFESKIVVDCDVVLAKEVCKDCGVCAEYCPTSALTIPGIMPQKKRSKEETATPRQARNGDTPGKPGVGIPLLLRETEQECPHNLDETRGVSPQPQHRHEKLLSLLRDRQQESGYLSDEFMAETARSLTMPLSEVYGVATFYAFLTTKPQGRYVIRVCSNIPCYLKNSEMIVEAIHKEIGIGPGETTPDRRFSLELTNCIGACDTAPAMLINDDVHGELTPEKVGEVLRKYK